MRKQILIEMAEMQLRAARDARKWATYHKLYGNETIAESYRITARACIRSARLFYHDAHTECWSVLRLKRGPKA